MEIALNQNDPKKLTYTLFPERFVASIFVSAYVVLEGQSRPIIQLVTDPNIYIALLYSTGIAVALIEYINTTTLLLDRFFPWALNFNKRLALQLLLCALTPIYLDLALVKFCFWLFELDFNKSGYIVSEFPLAKMLIYLMNIYYMGIYFGVTIPKAQYTEIIEDTKPTVPAEIIAPIDKIQTFKGNFGIKKRVIHVNELQCFKRESGTAMVWLRDKSIWFIDYTTNEFERNLDPIVFFKINRNVILAFDIIDSYKSNGKRGEVTFIAGVDFDVDKTISRDQYSVFKTAFKSFIEQKFV